jgi:PHD/YefM family antitoxin component YafN of YafNO toxin-antitoxin module
MPAETTYTSLRENLASVLDRVVDQQETVVVRRKRARDVTLLPATELAGLMETAHLLRSSARPWISCRLDPITVGTIVAPSFPVNVDDGIAVSIRIFPPQVRRRKSAPERHGENPAENPPYTYTTRQWPVEPDDTIDLEWRKGTDMRRRDPKFR